MDDANIENILRKYRPGPAALLPALREAQQLSGWLSEAALVEISMTLGVPISHIYGVVTFYDEFYLAPHGRNKVTVCRGSACAVKGGKDIFNKVKKILGVEDGETSPDYQFTLETVACFGNCSIAPAMLVNRTLYGDLTPESAEAILKEVEAGSTAAENTEVTEVDQAG